MKVVILQRGDDKGWRRRMDHTALGGNTRVRQAVAWPRTNLLYCPKKKIVFYSILWENSYLLRLNLKYVAFGNHLLSQPHVSGWQCTNSIHSTHFPQLCHFILHHPSFPTVIPLFLFFQFILNSVGDATPPHFFVFLPPLPRWQLSLRTAKILHLWQLCFFWFCSLCLGPTEGPATVRWVTERVSWAILRLVLYLPPSSSSQIWCLSVNKCSSAPFVLQFPRTLNKCWKKDAAPFGFFSLSS